MDSSSDEESVIVRRQIKKNTHALIDSDTESNSSNHSSSDSESGTPVKSNAKRSSKRLLDSNSDSKDDSNSDTEDSGSEDEIFGTESEDEIVDSESEDDNRAVVGSRRQQKNESVASLIAKMSLRNNDEDEVIPESDQDGDEMTIRSDSETDSGDLREQSLYLSPRTRRSIIGRVSVGGLISDESEQSEDDSSNKSPSSAPQSAQSSATTNDIIEESAAAGSSNSVYSTPVGNSSTDNVSRSHGSVNKSQTMNVSSVVFIDSSDEEVFVPPRRLSDDFNALPHVSTPVLVQPTFKGAIKKIPPNVSKKGVSQQHYDQNIFKLSSLKTELVQNRDLLMRLSGALPDNGANLRVRISKQEQDIRKQEKYIETIFVEEELVVTKKPPPVVPEAISWTEIEKGANAIKSKFDGVIGAANFAEEREEVMKSLKSACTEMENCPKEDKLAPTPNGLKISLMPHQQYALSWMLWREKQKHPCGGILGDDMGLGKTLSTIALVLASEEAENEENGDKEESSDTDDEDEEQELVKTNNQWTSKGRRNDYYYGGTLIVCPASLINQWEKEIESRVKRKYCSVRMHHGNSRETNARQLAKHTIVITTYGVINSELKNRGALFKIRWDRMVLDEGHVIRNHTTAMAQSCYQLKGKRRWVLTGTPIQNKEMDLFSLWKFLRVRGFENIHRFKKWMQINTTDGQIRLNARLRPMFLRRTKLELQAKGELQGLPDKNIEIVAVALKTDEMNVYSKILTLSKSLFAQFMHQRTQRQESHAEMPRKDDVFWKMHEKFKRMQGSVGEVKSSQILVLLTRLRQICDHPGLIDAMLQDEDVMGSESEDEGELKELDLLAQINRLKLGDNETNNNLSNDVEKELISRASSKVLLRSNPVFDLDKRSSKCHKVLEIIRRVQSDGSDKLVVVSQWTSVLSILANHLNREHFNFVELTGKTPIKLRNDIVVNFNNPKTPQRIMLLSLVAGGVGLNLTGANHLILVDPHWNPQLESQAFDRIYRVGQSKPVKIYKLLCENTVESIIQSIQERKMNLSNNVLTGSKTDSASKLSFQDLCQLFQM